VIEDGAEAFVVACHCIDCQKRSGSPFGVIAYFSASAVSIHGEAREHTRPTDEGNTFTSGFCPTCGSTLFGLASKHPDLVGVTVGTISDPTFPPPNRSIYEQSRHHWVALPEATVGFARGPDGERSR